MLKIATFNILDDKNIGYNLKCENISPALLKYMQMHAFAYILTRLFIALQLIALQ